MRRRHKQEAFPFPVGDTLYGGKGARLGDPEMPWLIGWTGKRDGYYGSKLLYVVIRNNTSKLLRPNTFVEFAGRRWLVDRYVKPVRPGDYFYGVGYADEE